MFVPLTRLQQALEQDGRANTVLLGGRDQRVDAPAEPSSQLAEAESAVRDVASLDDLGLRLRVVPDQRAFAVEAAAGLINDATAEVSTRRPGRTGSTLDRS